jgi:predicted small lipoprotein YifL
MKTVSYVLLLMIAVTTLTACGEQGVGPSKPAATATQESAK